MNLYNCKIRILFYNMNNLNFNVIIMEGRGFYTPNSRRVVLPIIIIATILSISISFVIVLVQVHQGPVTKTSVDSNGVTKIFETKGGKPQEHYGFEYDYDKRLDREQFYLENIPILDGEYTAYIKLDNRDEEEDDVSFKLRGGEHNDRHKNAGRSYAIGTSFDGDPYLAKEYPRHPITPKFLNEIRTANDDDGTPKNIGSLDNRWVGLKVVVYNKQNSAVQIEVYVDNKGLLSNGKPANEWKLWWTAVDDGKWENSDGRAGGEPYLELQGEKGGTPEMAYIRIDKMKEKGQTEIKYESAREIDASKKLA
jgi:hypothetical protein